ncbi:MAG: alpha/beta fold hydrolase [Gemmatimonadaceae bacterium]
MHRLVRRRWAMAIAAVLVAAVVFLPLRTRSLRSRTRPLRAYADAVQRVAAMRAFEQPLVNRYGGTILLTHGVRAPRVAVLLHGLTATPRQFQALAEELFARGYDVFVPRMPMHGERGRDATALSALTADTLRSFADDAIDIAHGLGDTVDVLGLSGGATIAAWIAQHRAGVRHVVIVAPALAFSRMPRALEDPAMQLLARLPNVNVGASADTAKPQVYAGFSTRAVAQTMRLGAEVRDDAGRIAPAARSIALVTNGNDRTIDAGAALALGDRWTQHGATVTRFQFDAALGLPHDVVDQGERCADATLVYPVLVALLEGRPAPPVASRSVPHDCINR